MPFKRHRDPSAWEECPICKVPFDDAHHTPMCLPCNHTLCRPCTQQLFPTAEGGRCPTCRELVRTSAAALRPNYHLRGLLQERHARSTSASPALRPADHAQQEQHQQEPPTSTTHAVTCTPHGAAAVCFCRECCAVVCMDCMMPCVVSHGARLVRLDDSGTFENVCGCELRTMLQRVQSRYSELQSELAALEPFAAYADRTSSMNQKEMAGVLEGLGVLRHTHPTVFSDEPSSQQQQQVASEPPPQSPMYSTNGPNAGEGASSSSRTASVDLSAAAERVKTPRQRRSTTRATSSIKGSPAAPSSAPSPAPSFSTTTTTTRRQRRVTTVQGAVVPDETLKLPRAKLGPTALVNFPTWSSSVRTADDVIQLALVVHIIAGTLPSSTHFNEVVADTVPPTTFSNPPDTVALDFLCDVAINGASGIWWSRVAAVLGGLAGDQNNLATQWWLSVLELLCRVRTRVVRTFRGVVEAAYSTPLVRDAVLAIGHNNKDNTVIISSVIRCLGLIAQFDVTLLNACDGMVELVRVIISSQHNRNRSISFDDKTIHTLATCLLQVFNVRSGSDGAAHQLLAPFCNTSTISGVFAADPSFWGPSHGLVMQSLRGLLKPQTPFTTRTLIMNATASVDVFNMITRCNASNVQPGDVPAIAELISMFVKIDPNQYGSLPVLRVLQTISCTMKEKSAKVTVEGFVEYIARALVAMGQTSLITNQNSEDAFVVLRAIVVHLCHIAETMQDVQWTCSAVLTAQPYDKNLVLFSPELQQAVVCHLLPERHITVWPAECGEAVVQMLYSFLMREATTAFYATTEYHHLYAIIGSVKDAPHGYQALVLLKHWLGGGGGGGGDRGILQKSVITKLASRVVALRDLILVNDDGEDEISNVADDVLKLLEAEKCKNETKEKRKRGVK
eukprot:PhM_4_TR13544/c1_g1_i1/m.34754